jgi:hypothetical protein
MNKTLSKIIHTICGFFYPGCFQSLEQPVKQVQQLAPLKEEVITEPVQWGGRPGTRGDIRGNRSTVVEGRGSLRLRSAADMARRRGGLVGPASVGVGPRAI